MRTPFLAAIVALVMGTSPALTCAFHNYAPRPSLVDVLAASSSIVAARPTAEHPYQYGDVVALKGETAAVEIPFLVDSATRRRLAHANEDRVLSSQDAKTGDWQRLAYLDADMRAVVDHLLPRISAEFKKNLRSNGSLTSAKCWAITTARSTSSHCGNLLLRTTQPCSRSRRQWTRKD